MKLILTNLLILFTLLTLTQGFRLRTKKFAAQRLKTRTMREKIAFSELIKEIAEQNGFELGQKIGKGGFGEVYSVSNNPDLVVKAINYKNEKTARLTNIEVQAQSMVKGLAFSLPLCKAFDIEYKGDSVGKAIVLPKAERDLFEESLNYYKEYVKTRKGALNKIGIFLGKMFAKKATLSKKYYALFEPKLKLFVEMALGLKEYHKKGFIHRDIKPENYLLVKEKNGNMRVVLADFGLATTAIGKLLDSPPGTKGYVPFDKTQTGKFKLTQKVDTFALGMTYLNMMIPQFFRCFYSKGKCKFNYFGDRISTFGPEQADDLESFRDHLNKTAKRQMSKIQKDVEDLVFEHLLPYRKLRATSEEFVQLLRKVVPKALFAEVEEEFENTSISCHGVEESESITDVLEEFDDIDEGKINNPKKLDPRIFEEIERDSDSGEGTDSLEEYDE